MADLLLTIAVVLLGVTSIVLGMCIRELQEFVRALDRRTTTLGAALMMMLDNDKITRSMKRFEDEVSAEWPTVHWPPQRQ